MADSSRRAVLRAQTAKPHAALEDRVGALRSRPAYVRYLRGSFAFRAPYEAALSGLAWPTRPGDWRPTLIVRDLAGDLTDLGAVPPSPGYGVSFGGRESLFGALYVLEGSSLGARIIYKDALRLGFTSTFGARHLASQARSLETWKGFLALLETAEGLDLPSVVQSANAVFEAAAQSFLEVDHDGE